MDALKYPSKDDQSAINSWLSSTSGIIFLDFKKASACPFLQHQNHHLWGVATHPRLAAAGHLHPSVVPGAGRVAPPLDGNSLRHQLDIQQTGIVEAFNHIVLDQSVNMQ